MSEISAIADDSYGGGLLGRSTDILPTQVGRHFGGRFEKIDGKKKWWRWCVWMIKIVLQKAFSNFYYYIYTYEHPRFRRLAPIQTSNRRDVIKNRALITRRYKCGRYKLHGHALYIKIMRCCTLLRHVRAHDKYTDCHVSNRIQIHNRKKIHIGLKWRLVYKGHRS